MGFPDGNYLGFGAQVEMAVSKGIPSEQYCDPTDLLVSKGIVQAFETLLIAFDRKAKTF